MKTLYCFDFAYILPTDANCLNKAYRTVETTSHMQALPWLIASTIGYKYQLGPTTAVGT